ncbi:hypothetical protein Hanom_Chr10g00881541 [Helianthus anomalus]
MPAVYQYSLRRIYLIVVCRYSLLTTVYTINLNMQESNQNYTKISKTLIHFIVNSIITIS